jgi:hypothetical protein
MTLRLGVQRADYDDSAAGVRQARVEKGAFGGLLFHGALGANVPRGTFS